MKKLGIDDIIAILLLSMLVLGTPVSFVIGKYKTYESNKDSCVRQGRTYNIELFGDSICEADDAGEKEILESDLAGYGADVLKLIPYGVKDHKIVKRIKNPDSNYTMEVVGKYGCSGCEGMQYHGIFRNVVSLEQENQMAERIAKEWKIVKKALAKKQAEMCNNLSGTEHIVSVKYDAKTNTCIIVSNEPVIYRESANGMNFIDSYSVPHVNWPVWYRLAFLEESKQEAEGVMPNKGVDLKEDDDSFKDFLVKTHFYDIESPKLKVSFPKAKTFSQDFAEKCSGDKNCTCEKGKNGDTICEKHVKQLVLVTKDQGTVFDLDHIAYLEIGYPDANDKEFNENGERVIDCSTSDSMECFAYGEDHVVEAKPFTQFDEKTQKFVVNHANVRLVFDNVKTVSNKTYTKYEKCRRDKYNNQNKGNYYFVLSKEDIYECAESVTNGNPQSLCLDTYLGAKYKNGICEIPFSGKVSKPEDLKNKKAFESCQINKIIAGKGNTATANAVCNGMKAKINLKNYQVQKRNGKNR